MTGEPRSRRDFLETLGKLALASAPAAALLEACRKGGRSRGQRPIPGLAAKVAIVPCAEYGTDELTEAIKTGWTSTDHPDVRNKRVVLKPNVIEFSPDHPIITDVRLVDAVVRFLIAEGAREIAIAEGPANDRESETLWKRSGYRALAEEHGLELIDLNYDSVVSVNHRLFPGQLLQNLFLPETVVTAEVLISLPKMKTHKWAGLTLSLKNMFGIVPGVKYGWPKNILHWNGIPQSICEINSAVRVHYSIVDAVVGMEGYGPLLGDAKPVGLLVMGDNSVAVDGTAARVMGIEPARVEYLQMARNIRLGSYHPQNIRLSGVPLERARRDFALERGFEYMRADPRAFRETR